MTELLPCPFCGAPARDDLLPHAGGPGWVQCSECECDQHISDTLEEAVARWNRRAPSLAPAQDAPEADIDKLRSVFEAAYGLCHGYDWNNGTAAKACGYRRKLLSAVNAIRPVPDFEGKYASPMREGER